MGVPGAEAVGILTLSPREAAMIAGDFATKAASVQIGFVDRFTGALVIQGSVASVEEALRYTVKALHDVLALPHVKRPRVNPMKRYVLLGTVGAGKSTLYAALHGISV